MEPFPMTRWKKLVWVFVSAGCLLALTVGGAALARSLRASAIQAVPTQISYQGYLTDDNGNPIDGDKTLTFRLYAGASGGTALWDEQQTVAVTDGYFSVMLGEVEPLEPDDFDGSTRYLSVQVAGSPEMTPRQPIVSVPYALSATEAVTASVAMRAISAAPGYSKTLVVSPEGGDYTSISAALAAIPDESGEDKRWLVWVGPGVYDESITIRGDVHVMGAGRRFTVIRSNASCTWGEPPVAATVVMSRAARLSGVAVRNLNVGGCGAAVLVKNADDRTVIQDARLAGNQYTVYMQGGNDGPVIEEVMAVGHGMTATLFYMDNSMGHLRDVIGWTYTTTHHAYGIYAVNDAVPDVRDVNFDIHGVDTAYGVYSRDSRMWVRHSKISAHDATENVGLYNDGSAATFRSYETMVKSDGAGVENDGGWFWIQGGVYEATTFGLRNWAGGELTAVGPSVLTERAVGQTFAALNWTGPATLTLRGGTYSAVGGSEAHGVMNYDAPGGVVAVEGATVTAEGASNWNWACGNDLASGNVYVRRSTLISRGGASSSAAIFNDYGGIFRVDSSQLIGDHYALRNASGTTYLAMTLADDGIEKIGGSIDCLNVYDASNQPVACP